MEWEKKVSMLFWLGTFVMVFFAGGVIIFVVTYLRQFYSFKQQEKDKLLRACLEVERTERKKISSYIHDTVCNDIYAVSIYLSILEQEEVQPDKRSRLAEVQHLLDDILNKTRDISYTTMSPLLEFSGLVPALEDYFMRFNKLHKIQISFQCLNELPRIDLSVSYEVYRILQEMANNMVKHGQFKNAVISIRSKGKQIVIKLEDDGIPFDIYREYKEANGMGIKNIFSRLRQIGGTLNQHRIENSNQLIFKFRLHD